MKKILTILILLTGLTCSADTYYVDAVAGNDANAGTISLPWKTSAKVSSFAYPSGTHLVLFKCGGTYDAVTIKRSNITISSYGTGAKPYFTTEQTLSFTSIGNGIYEAVVNTADSMVSVVTLNGRPVAMGRYPNAGTANGGYLTYESFSGIFSITDNQLTSAINWKGAKCAVKKNDWTLEILNITDHIAGTLYLSGVGVGINGNYNNPNIQNGIAGFGYFIEDDIRTLDQPGEWYFNKTTKKLQMYFGTGGPGSSVVKVATKSNVINIGSYSNVTIKNVKLAYSVRSAVYATLNSADSIINCDVENAGFWGIQTFQCNNVIVQDCNVKWCLYGGITAYSGGTKNGVVIQRNNVSNCGKLAGMAPIWDAPSQCGIYGSCNSNVTISHNTIDSTGLAGIKFQGTNSFIRYNVITNYNCVTEDQAAIYTFQGGTQLSPGTVTTNKEITDNIIGPGFGPTGGTNHSGFARSSGIYTDGRTKNTLIARNWVYGVVRAGILANNPGNISILDNHFINCAFGLRIQEWDWDYFGATTIKRNVFYTRSDCAIYFQISSLAGHNAGDPFRTVAEALEPVSFDSNYYNRANEQLWQIEKYDSMGYQGKRKGYIVLKHNLAAWQGAYGNDINSKTFADFDLSAATFITSSTDTSVTVSTSITPAGNVLTGVQSVSAYSGLFAGPYSIPTPPPSPVEGFLIPFRLPE